MEHWKLAGSRAVQSCARRAVAASALDDGQTVVLAARVANIVSDAQDGGRLRLRVMPVLGPAPAEAPDDARSFSAAGRRAERAVRRVPSGERLEARG